MRPTSTGLAENVAGLLCYVLGWVSGVIFLLLEPKSRFVRFHAFQAIIVFGILNLAGIVLDGIPLVGGFLAWLAGVLSFIVWIVLMVKAFQGRWYKLPWAGEVAEKWVG